MKSQPTRHPPRVLLSIIAGPNSWDPETGHFRIESRWFRWFFVWFQTFDPEKVALTLDFQREVQVAHARSLGIRRARIDKPDQYWQIDTDVQIEHPVHDVAELVTDCRDRGFSLVTSPGMSSSAVIEVSYMVDQTPHGFEFVREPKEHYVLRNEEPFEIDKGWGGFMAFTRKGYSELPAVGYSDAITGHRIDQYCFSAPNHDCPKCGYTIPGAGEDVMMYQSLRKAGMKACADPRIHSTHLKIAGLKSLRLGMSVGVPKVEGELPAAGPQ